MDRSPSRITPGTARRTLTWAAPHAPALAAFLVVVVVDGAVMAANPLVLRAIVDDGVARHDGGLVLRLGAIAATLAVADAALTFAQQYLSARIGEGLVFDLRGALGRHLQELPLGFFTQTRTGALISRLSTDVLGAQRAFTDLLSNVVGNLVTVSMVLLAMFTLSWQLTIAALLLLPLFVLPVRLAGRRSASLSRQTLQVSADLSSLMTERFSVAGALVAKLFGRPADEAAALDRRAGRLRDLGIERARYAGLLTSLLILMAGLGTALVYAGGGYLVARGALGLGTVVALATYLGRLYGPLRVLASLQTTVAMTLVAFERIFEVLDLRPALRESPDAVELPRAPGRVEFDEVGFAYPLPGADSIPSLAALRGADAAGPAAGRARPPVLSRVSFTIEPGQLVALVGPSGAGKTTISMLLSRLYDVSAGAVRINGVDVRNASTASLRAVVGVATQDPHLFHDTIRANLLYGAPEATEADLLAALTRAQLAPLLARLPDGLDSLVGERGYQLSGGEKQRLGLARLILRSPQVVVLDEATAHLDAECEAAVQRALQAALAGRSSLVIAHRLSTVRRADLLLVVDGGQVVERGTHEELLRAGGRYAALYRTHRADGSEPARCLACAGEAPVPIG
jgi:ATP-binding cassette subfamily B protein